MPIPHLALLFLFLWVTVFEPELICLLSLHHWRCSLQWGSCSWLRAMPVRFTAVNPRQLGDGCIGPDSGSVCQATVSSTLGYLAHFKVERLWQIGFTGASWLSSRLQIVDVHCHCPLALPFSIEMGTASLQWKLSVIGLFPPWELNPQPLPCYSRWTTGWQEC